MSAKDIVGKLRSMAADPAHRGNLVKQENCLPSVVLFLKDSDPEISFCALEVIYFLSLHVDNRPQMAQEPDLLKTIKRFMMHGKLKEKKVAIAAYTNLQAYATNVPETQPEPEIPVKNENSAPSSVTEKVIYAHSIFVAGLNCEAAKKEIEGILICTKGIISIYCDLVEQKIVVRTTHTADVIISMLSENGKKASLKKKDIISEDSGYLEEEEEDSTSGSKSSWFGFGINKFGEDKKKKQEEGGWMSKLGKALYII